MLDTTAHDRPAGSSGKTTTSWLIRGIFEEWGKLTGMMGSIENALYADKLDAEGNLWVPDEADPTLDRFACHILLCMYRILHQISVIQLLLTMFGSMW